MNENQSLKEIVVQYGAKSFVSAKSDWLSIDKVHLSFVQHTGLKSGCKLQASIEAAMPIYKATGKMVNGVPEDSVSGLEKLAYMVENGSIFKRLQAARNAAEARHNQSGQTGDIYCESVFEYIGGSNAKTRDGVSTPVRYRRISISPAAFKPGMKNANIIMEAFECDGATTSTAGFVPQKGCPNKVQIRVGFKPAEFTVFIRAIMNVWRAELTRRAIVGEQEFYRWRDHQDNAPAPAPATAPAQPEQVVPKKYQLDIIVAHDSAGDLFIGDIKANFINTFRNGLSAMLKTERAWVLPKDEANKALTAINGTGPIPTVRAHSKSDTEAADFISFRRLTLHMSFPPTPGCQTIVSPETDNVQ